MEGLNWFCYVNSKLCCLMNNAYFFSIQMV
uniref:Uncharacterized protein n=1 Tax=Arundo donax TaxID=35708 RepID=A0A0A9GVY5_ARUDO